MLRRRKYIFIMLLTALLSACGEDLSGGGECLVGSWGLTGTEAFLMATIPPGAFENPDLKLATTTGFITYTFKENGTLAILASQLFGRFRLVEGGVVSLVDIYIDGVVEAEFTWRGSKITTGKVKSSNIQYLAVLDNFPMMDTTLVREFLPLFLASSPLANFTCSGDSLTLEIQGQSGSAAPITFEREK